MQNTTFLSRVKAPLLFALLTLGACNQNPTDSIKHLDVEQFACPWMDDTPVATMPDAPDGMCWCVRATPTSVPVSAAHRGSPCDATELPPVYCTAPGGEVAVWHKIGTGTEDLQVDRVPCDQVPN
jgi:hypothetical protein